MAAVIPTRKLTKGCLRRLAILTSISTAVHSPPLTPQASLGSKEYCLSVENVRNFRTESACQSPRRVEDLGKRTLNLSDGSHRQQRWYARSNSEKSKLDADSIAIEMIKYAASCRNQEASHGEAVRVLEQGRTFLLSEGPAAATATGRVLLALATFYVDRQRLTDAVDALQVASDLEPAALEVRVAALEALAGLCLRLHQEEPALRYANSCGQLVRASSDKVPKEELKEYQCRASAIAALAALVCARYGAADSRLFEDVPTWLGKDSRRTAGVVAAVLSIAQYAHVGGYLKIAGELYERAIAIVGNSKEGSELTLASAAMAPDEVHIGALAGLGQLACNLGDFDRAEGKITEALTLAEKINGDKHPRVGIILACLADVYASRGKATGTGDTIITEGLYRRCQEYLGTPPVDVPDTGKLVDLVDIMALSRARYADVISKIPNRDVEAYRLQKWANTMWKGPRPLTHLLKVDAAQRSLPKEDLKATECSQATGENPTVGRRDGYLVIDVRLGRVIWKVR